MKSTPCILLVTLSAALGLVACSGENIKSYHAAGGNSSVAGSLGEGGSGDQGGATTEELTGGAGPNAGTGGTSSVFETSPYAGGAPPTGGAQPSGGAAITGGTRAMGGSRATGTRATGGTPATGGAIATGGVRATGGAIAAGGSRVTGGAAPTGGTIATGGTGISGGTTSPSTATHTNPLSQALIDEFVSAHNAARSSPLTPPPSPALPPVSWDYTLADSAYNYLSKCPGGSVDLAPHNANRTADYKALGGTDSVGENIYASTGSTVSPTSAVNSWMSEASSYDYNTNNITAAGHYTQIVWRNSVRIGCAIVKCSNYKYSNTILCDYAPAGNYTNQKPY